MSVPHDLAWLARHRGDGVAWIWEPEVRAWRWAEVAAHVGGIASELLAQGARPGERIAVVGGNTPEWTLLREAARWLRLVFVPVGPRLAPPERDWILRNAEPRWIWGDPELETGEVSVASWSWVHEVAPRPLPPRSVGGVATQLLYTSGSSGRPKGVLRPAAADRFRIAQMIEIFGLRSTDRHLVAGPLYHSGPAIFFAVFGALGAPQRLLRRFDPERVWWLLTAGEVDAVFMVPTMWRMLLEVARGRPQRARLRRAWVAGSPLDPETRAELLAWLGEGVLWEFYGSTETGTVTLLPPEYQRSHGHTVGFPAPGVEVRILDAGGRRLPPGRRGRIFVRSPMCAEAYHQGPDSPPGLRLERDLSGRFLTVGDRGYLTQDGALVLEGREGGMVITGGINVHPEEVEAALRALPGVREAVVFGLPDATWGETIAAAVEPESGAELTPEALAQALRRRIAGYKVPRRWFIGTIPRTPSEKVVRDRVRLAALFDADQGASRSRCQPPSARR